MSSTAASAVPAARAPPSHAARRSAGRQRWSRARSSRTPQNTTTGTRTWKFVAGWPPNHCRPMTTASPVNGSGPGRRSSTSPRASTSGRQAQTLIVVHETQLTHHRLKPKTSPAKHAAARRIPSNRAKKNVPRAARKTFRAATSASELHSPRT